MKRNPKIPANINKKNKIDFTTTHKPTIWLEWVFEKKKSILFTEDQLNVIPDLSDDFINPSFTADSIKLYFDKDAWIRVVKTLEIKFKKSTCKKC